MVHFVKVYISTIVVFLAIDFLWLGVFMSRFYKSELGILARRSGDALTPNLPAAMMVYVLIPLGIILFAVPRVPSESIVPSSLIWGFFYGIILYGVYDMTNYALIDHWPLRMSLVDIVWGGTICAIVTSIATFLDRWMS